LINMARSIQHGGGARGGPRAYRSRTAVVAVAFICMASYLWFITAALMPKGESESSSVGKNQNPAAAAVQVAATSAQQQRESSPRYEREFDHAYATRDSHGGGGRVYKLTNAVGLSSVA
jgi:hypothetical protein